MAGRAPFVLLDDARAEGAAEAHLFENPREVFVARRPTEVEAALSAAERSRRKGGTLAGYIAYEAGLALEPKLARLGDARTGAAGSVRDFGVGPVTALAYAPDGLTLAVAGRNGAVVVDTE